MSILKQIQSDFFDNNPVIIQERLEGQGIDVSGNFALGCMAGNSYGITNLLHEISHLAEREIEKLLKKPLMRWGFTYGKYWECAGSAGYEPRTDASVRREARVWAYQWNLMHHYGVFDSDNKVRKLVSSAIYINSWCYYQYKVAPKNRDDINNREGYALDILVLDVQQLAETEFTYSNFCKAWYIRMQALKDAPGLQK